MAWTTPRTWTVGEVATAALFNEQVRDNLLAIRQHAYVRKTADESVYNSTTLQDDDELLLPVAANETWIFDCFIRLKTDTGFTRKTKFGLRGPTGAVLLWGPAPTWSTTFSPNETALDGTQTTSLTGSDTQTLTVYIVGLIRNSSTAGNLKLQWAQDIAETYNHTVYADSYLVGLQCP